MAVNYLNQDIKEFIVTQLACGERPSRVAALVKERFGVEIKRQTAHLYDPTRKAGNRLSAKLKNLFYKCRKEWKRELKAKLDAYMKERIARMCPNRLP